MTTHLLPETLPESALADERLRTPGWHAFTRSRVDGHVVEAWVRCEDEDDAFSRAEAAKLADPRLNAAVMLIDEDSQYEDSYLVRADLTPPPDPAETVDGMI